MKCCVNHFRTVLILAIFWSGTLRFATAQDMHMAGMTGMKGMADSNNIYIGIMNTMMLKMAEVPKGQPASKTFVSQMIPHHVGAIAMADYEIRNGKDFDMIQLAKSIRAEQQSELVQMKILLTKLDITAKSPQYFDKEMDNTMEKMMKNMPAETSLKNIDDAFARVMLPHHQAAIDMARVLLKYPENAQVSAFARQLISDEQIEIEQMSNYIKK